MAMSLEQFTRMRDSGLLRVGDTFSWDENQGSYGPFEYYKEGSWSRFYDVYEPYGTARWQYKPCLSSKVQFKRRKLTLANTRPQDCAHMTPDRWWSGTYAAPNPFQLDYESLAPDVSIGTAPANDWIRLANTFSNQLPSLGSEAPDYFVFFSEIRDVLTTVDFLKAKSLLDKVAGGLLSWKFGVEPTLRELKDTCGVIKRVGKRLVELQRGAGKVHTTRAHVKCETQRDVEMIENYCPWPSWRTCSQQAWSRKTITTDRLLGVTAKYRYHFPEYMFGLYNKMIPVIRAYNMMLNWEQVWEMVPFSFVVDWVFSTEKLFRLVDGFMDPHDVQVDIIDLCVTQKLERETLVEVNWQAFSPAYNACYRKTETHFERTVGTNALYSRIPWVRIPTRMQFTLGAALAWAVGLIPRFK
jgi:hypothetical protein